jgi:menaquinone-dependent protoporphyrinogen IX oxidase
MEDFSIKIAVIYKSKYGTTRQYAEWLAEELDADLFSYKEFPKSNYDLIIYGGGLYAGKFIIKKHLNAQNIIFFTVGLSDPNTTDFSGIIKNNFSDGLPENSKIFHLRGGIDYENLTFLHKIMMSMLKKSVLDKKPYDECSDEEKLFIDTFGKQVDFVSENAIIPILDRVKQIRLN